jgi:hypothetical protein
MPNALGNRFLPQSVGAAERRSRHSAALRPTARIHLELVTGVYQPPVATAIKVGECIYVVPIRCELNPRTKIKWKLAVLGPGTPSSVRLLHSIP